MAADVSGGLGPAISAGEFTFIFSDIEGSTQRWERDPEAMGAALRLHDGIMEEAMRAHRGHVFKTMGDAFYVVFPTPEDAVAAALAAQRALVATDFTAVGGIRVRMSIHGGPVEVRGADFFGQPLNRVARMLGATNGGQVVLSNLVAETVRDGLAAMGGAGLHDLGEHRLKDLAEPEHIWQLTAPGLPSDFAPLKSAGTYRHNLPEHPSSFIGREAEAQEVGELVAHHQIVTLVGTGGLGKTRLSLKVGLQVLGSFPDGVWFVELAPLADPQLVAETVAGVLAVTLPSDKPPAESLVHALRQKKLLLVIDNCEHLVAATAELAAALARGCPHLSILASSREALRIPGEHIFRMPAMGFPDKAEGLS
ncbi:MAG TPA: adenylate/guanylate cyclase domain-containing protein, partial [Stellaceae bacterium]|nr:adenylate/guanylate cyclase domain-containing protein [Stellaceae bacterium]